MSKSFAKASELEEVSTASREKIALKILDYSNVKALILEAASQGFDGVRVAQKEPVPLDKTKAAISLISQLKKQGYQTSWVDAVSGMEGFSADHMKANQYNELLIVWGSLSGNILHKVEQKEVGGR